MVPEELVRKNISINVVFMRIQMRHRGGDLCLVISNRCIGREPINRQSEIEQRVSLPLASLCTTLPIVNTPEKEKGILLGEAVRETRRRQGVFSSALRR